MEWSLLVSFQIYIWGLYRPSNIDAVTRAQKRKLQDEEEFAKQNADLMTDLPLEYPHPTTPSS